MNKHHKGFSVIECLIILLIAVAVGLVGWYIWHNRTTGPAQSDSTPSEQPLTEVSAAKAVTDFYEKYLQLDPPGNRANQEAFFKQYGTDNLLAYFRNNQNGVNPIVCAQDLPENITIVSTTINQGVGTVAVELFEAFDIGVTATVVDQSGLKIDALACSKPLPAGDALGP